MPEQSAGSRRGPDPVPPRHSVTFESYADVCCADDGGQAISTAFGLVHHAIVAGARVAVAFPDMSSDAATAIGCRLRIMGAAGEVAKAVSYAQDDGLALSKIGFVTKVAPIPSRVMAGAAYVRVRDPGVGEGELRRRDKRARLRRGAGKNCFGDETFAERARVRGTQFNPTHGKPSLQLVSGSTRQGFLIHVGRHDLPVNEAGFTSYGLSGSGDTGRGAVPVWE